MSQLLHTKPESDSDSNLTSVAISEHGAAIHRDGSLVTLQAATELGEALHSAAALVVPETGTDGDSANLSGGNMRHFLLASSGAAVLHNGTALRETGIVALTRKDEIFVTSEQGVRRFYYSDEVIPEPEAIPAGLSEDACCPRCQRSLHALSPTAEGLDPDDDPRISRTPLIRCGGCRSLMHAHGCYDYEPTCIICLAPTTEHKLWTPEELE